MALLGAALAQLDASKFSGQWKDCDKCSRRPRPGLRHEIGCEIVDPTKRRRQDFEGKVMQPKTTVMKIAIAVSLLATLTMVGAPDNVAYGQSLEKLTVRFTWKLKGEYAPLYVALEKGYYKAEGLDVQLAEGNGAQNVLKALAAGNENFGYGPAVAAAQAVSQGLPVKVVALYQTSASMGVISYPDTPLKGPKDLEGKRLAISVGETFGDMIRPFARLNNVDLSKIQLIQMDASARTMQFLTRKIDVMSVYLSNELPQIEKRAGVKFKDSELIGVPYRVNIGKKLAEGKVEVVDRLLHSSEDVTLEALPAHIQSLLAASKK